MVDFQCKDRYGWEDLLEITRLLRSPGGCPWDREQTHGSIRRNFLEETYEVLDALDRDDPHGMCEELGDVLMQVALHAQMEAERGRSALSARSRAIFTARATPKQNPALFAAITSIRPPR